MSVSCLKAINTVPGVPRRYLTNPNQCHRDHRNRKKEKQQTQLHIIQHGAGDLHEFAVRIKNRHFATSLVTQWLGAAALRRHQKKGGEGGSTLDTAGDNALFQLVLEEGEHDNNGKCCCDHHRKADQITAVIRIGGVQEVIVVCGDLLDPQLQGLMTQGSPISPRIRARQSCSRLG